MSECESIAHCVMVRLDPAKFLADRIAVLLEPGAAIAVAKPGQDFKKGTYDLRPWPTFGLFVADPRSELQPGILYEQRGRQVWEPILRDDEVKVI